MSHTQKFAQSEMDEYREHYERSLRRRKLVIMLVVALILSGLAYLLNGCAPTPTPASPPPTPLQPVVKARATNTQRPTREPTPTPFVCEVSTGYESGTVNVRAGPGMSYPVVAVVVEGEPLILTGRTEPEPEDPALTWSEVKTPGRVTGWFICDLWCTC